MTEKKENVGERIKISSRFSKEIDFFSNCRLLIIKYFRTCLWNLLIHQKYFNIENNYLNYLNISYDRSLHNVFSDNEDQTPNSAKRIAFVNHVTYVFLLSQFLRCFRYQTNWRERILDKTSRWNVILKLILTRSIIGQPNTET